MSDEPERIVLFAYDAESLEFLRLLDGVRVKAVRFDGKVVTGTPVRNLEMAVLGYRDVDGKRLHFVDFVNASTTEIYQRLDLPEEGEARVVDLSFDGTQAAVLTRKGKLILCHRDPGSKHWAIRRVIEAYTKCDGSDGSAKFDHAGKRVVTAMYSDNEDSAVKVWDTETDQLIFSWVPNGHLACRAIFAHAALPNIVFAVSHRETVQIDLSDGSVTPFNGHAGNHSCWGDVLALSDDFTTFYVGYSRAKCVVAYNVATMHSIWSTGMPELVNSVSCHAGMVLVGVAYSEFAVLDSDGHVLRHFGKVADGVYGHAVLKTVLGGVVAPDPKYVVGLDLGTTFSGFTVVKYHKPDHTKPFVLSVRWISKVMHFRGIEGIQMNELFEQLEWKDNMFPYPKAPTVLLYDGSQMTHWGWTAERRRSENPSQFFAHRFKLHLADNVAAEVPALPPFVGGRGAVPIIAEYLRAMVHNVVMPLLTEKYGAVEMRDVLWCLTVPAIWSDRSKSQMKRAAELAGLIRGKSSLTGSIHPLQIVLEPEAAALYSLCMIRTAKAELASNIDHDAAYMVVDCGGGTVDLTVHGFVKDVRSGEVKLVELQPGSGGLCGGIYVDEQFYRWLASEVFTPRDGVPPFDEMAEKHPGEMHGIRTSWTGVKHTFSEEDLLKLLEIPPKLRRYVDRTKFPDVDEDTGVFVPIAVVKQCFDHVLVRIRALIREQVNVLKEHQDYANKKIFTFLVGGFSQCQYLHSALSKEFGKQMQFVRIENAGAAISRGAAIFGLNPYIFTSRCARRAYGVEAFRDASYLDIKTVPKEIVNGKVKIFQTIVFYGQTLEVGKLIPHQVDPLNLDLAYTRIPLLASKSQEGFQSCYRSDPSLFKVGDLVIPVPANIRDFADKTIVIEFEFGGPVITVRGYYKAAPEKKMHVVLQLDELEREDEGEE